MFVNLLITTAPLFIVSFLNQYFLFAHSQSIPYLVEAFDINQSVYTNQPSIQSLPLISTESSEIPENCTRALQIFTENVVNFTRCTLLNARPIRVCVNCNQINSATIEAYNQLQKVLFLFHRVIFRTWLISEGPRADIVLGLLPQCIKHIKFRIL